MTAHFQVKFHLKKVGLMHLKLTLELSFFIISLEQIYMCVLLIDICSTNASAPNLFYVD